MTRAITLNLAWTTMLGLTLNAMAGPEWAQNSLPVTKTIIKILSDDFSGKALNPAWEQAISPENIDTAAIKLENGCLSIVSDFYKYANVKRLLFRTDNFSIQVAIRRKVKDHRGSGLWLYWAPGTSLLATVGNEQGGKYRYWLNHAGGGNRQQWYGSMNILSGKYRHGWVKLTLTPDKILCFGSPDGKTWVQDVEIERVGDLKMPPVLLILGKGQAGIIPDLQNDEKKSKTEGCGCEEVSFADLVVAKE